MSVLNVPPALSMLLCVSRVSGVAPLRRVRGKLLTTSKPWARFGYLLITAINTVTLSSVVNDLTLDPSVSVRTRTFTRSIVWIADAGIMTANAFHGTYGALDRMRTLIYTLAQMQKISKELNTSLWSSSTEMVKSVLTVLWLAFAVVISMLDHRMLVVANDTGTREKVIVGMYACYYYCYWVMNLVQIQYILLALLINASFKTINRQLRTVIKVGSSPQERADAAARRLAHAYVVTCQAMRRLNRSYGPMLVLLLLSYVVHLIVTPYYLVFNLSDRKTQSSTFNTVVQFMWCYYHASTLIMMIEPSHATAVQLKLTRELVSKLMRCCKSYEALAAELELFTRHLLLNRVSYSPMQVTTLSRALVATVFGSVTTYLVLIMQS